jgi:WD40 repeat protein
MKSAALIFGGSHMRISQGRRLAVVPLLIASALSLADLGRTDAQPDDKPIDLKGHRSGVDSLDFSPDGTKLVTVSGGSREIRLWDLAKGTSRVLVEQRGQREVRFLADGQGVVVGTHDSGRNVPYEFAVRHVETGEPGKPLPGNLVEVSPAGTAVVQGQVDGASGYRIWDVKAGKEVIAFKYASGVQKVTITRDGKTVAVWGQKTVQLFDVPSGKERSGIQGLQGTLDKVAFSPDGKLLACYENGVGLSLWDVADPAKRPRLLARQPIGGRRFIAFSTDGRTLVVDNERDVKKLVLVDVATFKPRAAVTASPPAALTTPGTLVALTAFRGNQFVVAGLTGKTLGVVELGDKHEGYFAVAPDGTRLAAALPNGTVRVLRLPAPGRAVAGGGGEAGAGPKKLADLPAPRLLKNADLHEDRRGESGLAFSPDGKYLVGSTRPNAGYFAAWDVTNGKLVASGGAKSATTLWCFRPDGKTLFVQEADAESQGNALEVFYDLTTGQRKVVGTIKRSGVVPRFRFTHMALAPDGKVAAAVTRDKRQLLLLPGGDVAKAQLLVDGIDVSNLAFSPDGKHLAVGVVASGPGKVRLFDVTQKKEVPTNAERPQHALAFADNGRTLATADLSERAAAVYDMESGQLDKKIDLRQGHTGEVKAVAFSPAGPVLASGDADGAVLVRNWSTGQVLARIPAHDKAVVAVAFSPDGKTLATATHGKGDGAVRLWSLGDLK